MTDRELLELAAKAAGLSNPEWAETVAGAWAIYHDYPSGGQVHWNPLTDDGDALRLAVQLKLDVDCFASWTIIHRSNAADICVNGEQPTATRRAIVRAAAAIGREA